MTLDRRLLGAILVALIAGCTAVPSASDRHFPENPRTAESGSVDLPKHAETTSPPASAHAPTIAPAQPKSPLDASVYRLDGGDTVRIDVLGEPDLSMDSPVDPSGFINYPFLGKVQASGLTVRELEARIRDGLRAGYLVRPDVRVALARYRPFFIGGQVRQPGSYPYVLGLTIERAVTLAGGITQFGSTGRIYIQRFSKGETERARASLDAPVYPGDYITVDERLF